MNGGTTRALRLICGRLTCIIIILSLLPSINSFGTYLCSTDNSFFRPACFDLTVSFLFFVMARVLLFAFLFLLTCTTSLSKVLIHTSIGADKRISSSSLRKRKDLVVAAKGENSSPFDEVHLHMSMCSKLRKTGFFFLLSCFPSRRESTSTTTCGDLL